MNRITALLISCAFLAAPMAAHASGPGGATTDPDVLGADDEDDDGGLLFSFGSLGAGGPAVAAVVAAALAAGLAGSDSGSH